jgi:hypothetical protein
MGVDARPRVKLFVPTWTNFTYLNSWSTAAALTAVAYTLYDGWVELRGQAVASAGAVTICALPVGLRPTVSRYFGTTGKLSTGSNLIARIQVDASGNVIADTLYSGYISLDNVRFIAEQ